MHGIAWIAFVLACVAAGLDPYAVVFAWTSAIAVIGMTVIIFDAVAGFYPALIAGGCALVLFATFWLVWPFSKRIAER